MSAPRERGHSFSPNRRDQDIRFGIYQRIARTTAFASALEVSALEPQRTTGVLTLASTVHNQDGVLVMDGEQRYLLRKRPAAGG